jgi:hypothetical protein
VLAPVSRGPVSTTGFDREPVWVDDTDWTNQYIAAIEALLAA